MASGVRALLPEAYASSVEVFDHPAKGRCLRSLVQRQPGDVVLREDAIATAPDLRFERIEGRVVHFIEHECFHCSGSLAGACAWPCEEGCDFTFCSPACGARHAEVHRAECAYVDALVALGARECVEASRLLLASRVAAASADAEQGQRVALLEGSCAALKAQAGVLVAAFERIEAAASAPDFVQADEGFELEPCMVQAEMLCKVQVNCLSLPGPAFRSVSALLSGASLCAHSCRPNCHVAHEGAGVVALRAVAPIAPGEEITISYLGDLGGSGEDRRAELARTRFFACTCERCGSASEAERWDSAPKERREVLARASHEVLVEREMELMKDLTDLLGGSPDAVALQAGRVAWRTLRAQFHVDDEIREILVALEPLFEACLPLYHPIKAQMYLEHARILATHGGDEVEFLRCCTAAQANADICFGPESVEAETMKEAMISGQTEQDFRAAVW
eukprot:CAMPEP_0203862738 /NCGR_PEP_ID=MMETSP0359-20131031/13765_1 /ASSEMBLY_ACC=CAM_ASM_000338 /TAXON_ID=268821 /ORGANISM="Scrippsiella Hangoei, Strain SHTV-5" /LENGTH=451 /DNA_ID=CAMNT_0050780181 /DNA_START=77 /DNA_END=1432 /DNA_ORIENTATION=+